MMQRRQGFLYTAENGDTLAALSRRFCVPVDVLISANPYLNIYRLRAGDELFIPGAGCGPHPMPSSPPLPSPRPPMPMPAPPAPAPKPPAPAPRPPRASG